jgi:colanic acid biosynthesis glycosyl transferase WcaI
MKILIVSQYFYPENFRINDLAMKLSRRGHEVTVLSGMPNYPEGKISKGYPKFAIRRDLWEGVEIIRVPLIPRQKSRGWQLALNYLSFLISACILSPFLLRGRNFDIIFSPSYSPATANIPAILIKWIKKIPMIMWVQDLWPQSLSATGAVKSLAVLKKIEFMMSWIYYQSNLILIQSSAFKTPITEIADVSKKIKFFPNWAEDMFQPLSQTDNEPLPKGFNVMFAGNLGQAQSLEVITRAAEQLRDQPVNWIILGDGRQADWLRTEIRCKDLSHCVHQLGRRPMESMPSYFAQADAMLVTLGPDPHVGTTIPGKIQSYLACGRPVIGALDGEGARVIKDSGSGFAVASGDASKLAGVVQLMASYSDFKRNKLGANGLAYYNQYFSSNTLIPMLEAEMKELIEDNS